MSGAPIAEIPPRDPAALPERRMPERDVARERPADGRDGPARGPIDVDGHHAPSYPRRMRRLALILATALAAPAAAQEAEPEGRSLVERGAEMVMRGLLQEMAPAIGDLERTMTILEGVIGRIEEYEAPEMLPNGDIIIRRKPEFGPDGDPGALPPGEELEL